MKLDETTLDEEKENTCNGNGINEKHIMKKLPIPNLPNGFLRSDTGSSSSPDVGDLLVEDPNPSRNDNEENSFQNGSKSDDRSSVSSNSSVFPTVDDDLSDDDMTLRLSDEDEPITTETDNLYFSSSPLSKSEEDNLKTEEKVTSAMEENANSEINKDTKSVNEEVCKNKDKDTVVQETNNKVKINELNNKGEVKELNNKEFDNKVSEISENSDENNSSLDKYEKSDDNLENLVSDLNEYKKSTLKPENKMSDIRKEIAIFINKHDNDDVDSGVTVSKSVESENNKKISVEPETKEISKIKFEEKPVENIDNNTEVKTSEVIAPEQPNNVIDSARLEVEPSTSKSEETEKDNSEIEDNIPENITENTEIINDEQILEKTSTNNTETKTSVDENKQIETMDIDETKATEIVDTIKLETKESDTSDCQKINPEPEKTLQENKIEIEIEEIETNPTKDAELETVSVENKINIEESEDTLSNVEIDNKKENHDSENVCSEPMDIEPQNVEPEKAATIIIDDVEMKEDIDNINIDSPINKQEETTIDIVEINDEEIKDDKIEIKEPDGTKKEIKDSQDLDNVEETRTSLKRALQYEEISQDAKKIKINGMKQKDESEKQYVRLDIFRDFMSKKEISTLTRAELEQFCLQKICEAVTQTSKIGELNRKILQHETSIEAMRTKCTSLSKQMRDLEVVHSKVLQEVRAKAKEGNCDVIPVKITRSVGLQVSLQPLTGRLRPQVIAAPEVASPLTKRKIQRNSLPNKLPTTPPNPMPPPSKLPVHKSPITGKGIKTILPKVYPAAEPKEANPSLLCSYLQNPPGNNVSPPTLARKTPSAAGPSTSAGPSEPAPKVIDLTDEDDMQRASGSAPAGNIRVVPPQQLQNTTSTPVTSASLPRLTTYLVQGNQQGQQVLLATSSAPTRPGQVRSTLMFKPVAPGQVPPGQRLNLVRPNTVPGITVLPSATSSAVRPTQQIRFATPVAGPRPQVRSAAPARHPAPLPGPPAVQPSQPNWKAMPPKPTLKISKVGDGIVLSWRMHNNKDMSLYEDIGSYQLYAYQETSGPPSTDMWRKVGDVKALALPMACTLTQFTDGNKYHFAVRAVDVKSRVGPFSQPEQIALP